MTVDHILGDLLAGGGARLKQLSERSGVAMDELVDTGRGTDPLTWFADHGWSAQRQSVSSLAARYGRDLSDPFAEAGAEKGAEPPWLDTAFVTAERPRGRFPSDA